VRPEVAITTPGSDALNRLDVSVLHSLILDGMLGIGAQQMAAQQRSIENIADHAGRKKKGLFERLASVGLGRKDEPAPVAQREPTMASQPRPQQVAPIRPQAPAEQHRPEPALDDDQLEIPAFLRRQAN
jgi:cell division protein FtsZ